MTHQSSIFELRWFLRCVFAGGVVAWMALIFYLSSISSEAASQTTGLAWALQPEAHAWQGWIKSVAGHLFLYGMLAALVQTSIWTWTGARTRRRFSWISVVTFTTLYAISDELHQSFTYGRSASTYDVFADVAGATASVSGLWWLFASKFFHRHIMSRTWGKVLAFDGLFESRVR